MMLSGLLCLSITIQLYRSHYTSNKQYQFLVDGDDVVTVKYCIYHNIMYFRKEPCIVDALDLWNPCAQKTVIEG